ncbi:MFS transporter, partial [Achromobacter mucicolens]
LPATPDVPTLAESGLPGFDVESWFGLVAPAGTPKPVIDRLNQAVNKALASPALQTSYKQGGFFPPQPPNTPETFAKKIASEIDKWGAVVKSANLKAN